MAPNISGVKVNKPCLGIYLPDGFFFYFLFPRHLSSSYKIAWEYAITIPDKYSKPIRWNAGFSSVTMPLSDWAADRKGPPFGKTAQSKDRLRVKF
jgi:hypothetical protein